MAFDLKAGCFRNRIKERVKLVTFKEYRLATILADQQMLVAATRPDKSLAAPGLVNTLNQSKLLKFFKGTIDTHQTQPRTVYAGRIIHFNRGQRTKGAFHRLNNCFARQSEPATVSLQNIEPIS
jgi:hypothetical protein